MRLGPNFIKKYSAAPEDKKVFCPDCTFILNIIGVLIKFMGNLRGWAVNRWFRRSTDNLSFKFNAESTL